MDKEIKGRNQRFYVNQGFHSLEYRSDTSISRESIRRSDIRMCEMRYQSKLRRACAASRDKVHLRISGPEEGTTSSRQTGKSDLNSPKPEFVD